MTAELITTSESSVLVLRQEEIPATPQSDFREYIPGLASIDDTGTMRFDLLEVTSMGCPGYPAVELRVELTADQHALIRSTMRPETDDSEEDYAEDYD